MKNLIYILVFLFLLSCSLTKDKTLARLKKENDITRREIIITDNLRQGGSVSKVFYPIYKPREKDSVAQKKQGSATLITTFKKNGSVLQECKCDEIKKHVQHYIDEIDKSIIASSKKTKSKEEKVSDRFILYIIIFLVFLVIFLMWYTSWSIKKSIKIL